MYRDIRHDRTEWTEYFNFLFQEYICIEWILHADSPEQLVILSEVTGTPCSFWIGQGVVLCQLTMKTSSFLTNDFTFGPNVDQLAYYSYL